MNTTIASRNGLKLTFLSIIIFLLTYFVFKDSFYNVSILIICFIYPTMYTIFAVHSAYTETRRAEYISLRTAFSTSMKTLMLVGVLYSLFLGLFFNYMDTQIAQEFNDYWHQQFIMNKEQILTQFKENPEATYDALLKASLETDFFSFSSLFQYFIFIFMPSYSILSLMIGLFFRRKPAPGTEL